MKINLTPGDLILACGKVVIFISVICENSSGDLLILCHGASPHHFLIHYNDIKILRKIDANT